MQNMTANIKKYQHGLSKLLNDIKVVVTRPNRTWAIIIGEHLRLCKYAMSKYVYCTEQVLTKMKNNVIRVCLEIDVQGAWNMDS